MSEEVQVKKYTLFNPQYLYFVLTPIHSYILFLAVISRIVILLAGCAVIQARVCVYVARGPESLISVNETDGMGE